MTVGTIIFVIKEFKIWRSQTVMSKSDQTVSQNVIPSKSFFGGADLMAFTERRMNNFFI
jgi:hypothetical protein